MYKQLKYKLLHLISTMNLKTIFSTTLLVMLTHLVFGQDSKLQIGVEFGPNIYLKSSEYSDLPSHLGQELTDKRDPAMGLTVIPTFQYNFHRHFSFRIGLGYQSLSEKYINLDHYQYAINDPSLIGTISYYNTYHMAHLPTQIRASFGNRTKFFVNAGTHLSILTKQSSHSSFVPSQESIEYPSYNKLNHKNKMDVHFGILMGLGVSTPINDKLQFSIEARNTMSLLKTSTLSRMVSPFDMRADIIPTLLFGVTYQLQ